jgi:hypothetical protein
MTMKMTRARALRTFALCLLPFALHGCGYALAGRGSFLPEYIKIIGVPQFINRTPTFNLDQIVTSKVHEELSGRGRYQVKPTSTGDAIINGTITALTIVPSQFNANQQASRYAVTLTAAVEFRDLHTNKILWSNPSMQFRDEYPVTAGTAINDPNQFFGQNTNALQRLAQNFAKSMVTSILENF